MKYVLKFILYRSPPPVCLMLLMVEFWLLVWLMRAGPVVGDVTPNHSGSDPSVLIITTTHQETMGPDGLSGGGYEICVLYSKLP